MTFTAVFLLLLNILLFIVFYYILRSRFSEKRILRDIRQEVDRLLVDLGREADRDVALLESRIASLRSLIDEADRRTALAGKETEKRRQVADIISVPHEPPLQTPSAAPHAPSTTLHPQPVVVRDEPVVIYTKPAPRPSAKTFLPTETTRDKVVDLFQKGFSSDLIASTLSLSLGEVELILDMNNSSM